MPNYSSKAQSLAIFPYFGTIIRQTHIGISSNGRTSGFGPEYRGSNPCIPANTKTAGFVPVVFVFQAGDSKRLPSILGILGLKY